MNALKKVAPFALLVLSSLATSAASNAQPTQGQILAPTPNPITIESMNVTNPDASKCVYAWTASIKNSGAKDITVLVKGGWGSLPFGETTVNVPAGKTVIAAANDIPFSSATAIWGGNPGITVKNANADKWFDSKTVSTGMPHWTKLELSAKAGASPTSYEWFVTNPSSFAYPANELNFQSNVSSSESGPWAPGGGKVGQCIPAHGSVSLPSTKPASATYAEINIKKWDSPLQKKVVPIVPALTIKNAGPIPQ